MILNDLPSLKFIIKSLNLVVSKKSSKFRNCYQLFEEYSKNKEFKIDNLNESLLVKKKFFFCLIDFFKKRIVLMLICSNQNLSQIKKITIRRIL